MNRLESYSPDAALQLSLQAYKSLISDYALRARQAEDMVKLLMSDIPAEVRTTAIVEKIKVHIELRELERATQYLGILQMTRLSLTSMLQRNPEDTQLIEIVKALTVAIAD